MDVQVLGLLGDVFAAWRDSAVRSRADRPGYPGQVGDWSSYYASKGRAAVAKRSDSPESRTYRARQRHSQLKERAFPLHRTPAAGAAQVSRQRYGRDDALEQEEAG